MKLHRESVIQKDKIWFWNSIEFMHLKITWFIKWFIDNLLIMQYITFFFGELSFYNFGFNRSFDALFSFHSLTIHCENERLLIIGSCLSLYWFIFCFDYSTNQRFFYEALCKHWFLITNKNFFFCQISCIFIQIIK